MLILLFKLMFSFFFQKTLSRSNFSYYFLWCHLPRSVMSADDQSDEEVVPIFRPFTRESLAAIEARIAEEKARKEHAQKGGEDGGGGEPQEEHHREHEGEPLEPDPNLEAGMPLPKMLLNELTPEVTAIPLEDIDKYYENKTVRHLHYITLCIGKS